MSRALGAARVVVSVMVVALVLSMFGAPAHAKKKRHAKPAVFRVSPLASSCGYSGSTLVSINPASPLVRMRKQWTKRYVSQYIRVTATLQGSDGGSWKKIKGAKRTKVFKIKRKWAKRWKTAPALPAFTGMSGYGQFRVKLQVVWYRPNDGRVDHKAHRVIASYTHGSSCPATYVAPVVPVVTSVVSGAWHNCAQMSDATVRCWGSGANGRTGMGDGNTRTTAVTVPGLTGVQSLAGGQSHTCVVVKGGTAKCFGYNSSGQLGDGTTTQRLVPTNVTGLPGAGAIWSGYNTTCAGSSGQVLKCWGQNNGDQLATGTTTNSKTPVAVAGMSYVLDAADGGAFVCAVRTNNAVYCWGDNAVGQLGNGNAPTDTTTTPAVVSGVAGASSVTAGSQHACAIVSNGAVKCWGANGSYQLGNNSTTNAATPVAVSGIGSGATAVAATENSTCAIVGGVAKCWGSNLWGQLGTGTVNTATTPQTVAGLSGLVGITMGGSASGVHTCAWNAAGQTWCWGSNSHAELGRGTVTDRETRPALVAGL